MSLPFRVNRVKLLALLVARYGSHEVASDVKRLVDPISDGGHWKNEYYSLWDLRGKLPAVPRCHQCGSRYRHWTNDARRGYLLATPEEQSERNYCCSWICHQSMAIAHEENRREEITSWKNAKRTLREIQSLLRDLKAPRSQSAELRPAKTSPNS